MPTGSAQAASEYRYRDLKAADLPAVRRLAEEAPEGDNDYPVSLLAAEMAGEREPEWVTTEGRRAIGIFDGDGGLVGVGCATPAAEGIADEGYISRVYIAPAIRGRGFGRDLARRLEEILAQAGCRRAFLYIWSVMSGVADFWLSCGFVREGTVGLGEDEEGFVVRLMKML